MAMKTYRDLDTDLGLSESTIRRMVERGEFPPPLMLSKRRVAWPAETVAQWLQARAVAGTAA